MASKAEELEKEVKQRNPWEKLKAYARTLGPGLIAGASGDDPPGIGTYSQPILYFYVSLLVIANTISLGADLGAMAAAAKMLFSLGMGSK